MTYNRITDSTTAERAVCAVVFCLFVFVFVYFYQTPTLAYAQHVLSKGATVYHRLPSALLVTVVLYLLQRLTLAATRLHGASHALTYLPSMLVLAFMTSVHAEDGGGLAMSAWVYAIPLILLLYFFIVKAAKLYLPASSTAYSFFSSRNLTVSLSIMSVMMISVLCLTNGNDLFNRQIKAERMLLDRDYAGLANEGCRGGRSFLPDYLAPSAFQPHVKLETDTTLTLLRAIALDKCGGIADSLFCQPVVGNTASLMQLENVKPLIVSRKFLMRRKSQDYRLCAMLVGRELDRFANRMASLCNLSSPKANDSLPRHFREALVLYQHLRSVPVTQYQDSVLEADYTDMRDMLQECATEKERQYAMWKSYRNTYWYYYHYASTNR